MADILNLQINGTPIVMYGLIGVTTAVLAYATAGGEFGNFASKTMGALSPDALIGDVSATSEGLGNLNPFDSKTEESSGAEEATDEPAKEEPTKEAPPEVSNAESGEETKGGKKKRNRKTPKKRKPNKRGKTKKRKTNKSKR